MTRRGALAAIASAAAGFAALSLAGPRTARASEGPSAWAAARAEAVERELSGESRRYAAEGRIEALSGRFYGNELDVWVDNATRRMGRYVVAPVVYVGDAGRFETGGELLTKADVELDLEGELAVMMHARLGVWEDGKLVYESKVKKLGMVTVPEHLGRRGPTKVCVRVFMGQ